MNINNTILFALFNLNISCIAYAMHNDFDYSRPEKCPSVSALQENVIVEVKHLIEKHKPEDRCCDASGFPYHIKGLWDSAYFIGNYNTNDKWKFSFYSISADSKIEALNEMNENLKSLRFAYGPAYEYGEWYCTYSTSGRDIGVWYVNERKDIVKN